MFLAFIKPVDLILLIVLIAIIGGSIAYTLIRRKKGLSCSSCSSGASCPSATDCHTGAPRQKANTNR